MSTTTTDPDKGFDSDTLFDSDPDDNRSLNSTCTDGYSSVKDGQDLHDEVAPLDGAPTMTVLVEKHSSSCIIYKKGDTGEILYTQQGFRSLKVPMGGEIIYLGFAPKDKHTAGASTSKAVSGDEPMEIARIKNLRLDFLDRLTGESGTYSQCKFIKPASWLSWYDTFEHQGVEYRFSMGWKGQVNMRRKDRTDEQAPLAVFRLLPLTPGRKKGRIVLSSTVVSDSDGQGCPDDTFLLDGKPTPLFDKALVAEKLYE